MFTYTDDAAGRPKAKVDAGWGRDTYSWTYENQLQQVEQPDGSVVTYIWAPVTKSADEFRVETETDAGVTRHFWDKHNIVWETDDIGTLEAEYTLEPMPYGNLISQRRAGESSFYHYDAMRSTRALTDDTETLTDSYLYRVFGDVEPPAAMRSGTPDKTGKLQGQIGESLRVYRDLEVIAVAGRRV